MSHNLIKIAAFDRESKCCHAVIETPKGSHHKFEYNPDLGCFELKKTLPRGMTLPADRLFERYNKLEGKEFRSTGACTPKRAKTRVDKGMKVFRKKH